MRPVFFSPENYPRYVGTARGDIEEYKARKDLGQPDEFKPIGYIPQVEHTYAYFEETYGALNEHQLGIAESTCSGVFGTKPRGHGGEALFSIDALSQIAMERTKTARAAVKLMGSLAEAHGFYGPGSFEGTAESLFVSDPEEIWIFHILPDPTGRSAIWAAQRVPPGHVVVGANAFIIREVNVSDSTNFLASGSTFTVAQERGWWDPSFGALLDFTAVYSDGEYDHKYYTGRRLWRAYELLVPGTKLEPMYAEYRTSRPYPVTLAAAGAVSLQDVLKVLRDHYEGTQFDMTKGLAAGPFGSPNRFGAGAGERLVPGNWERSIALYRTTDAYVAVSAGAGDGVLWFGPGAAHGTVFVPLKVGMARVPHPYSHGNPMEMAPQNSR